MQNFSVSILGFATLLFTVHFPRDRNVMPRKRILLPVLFVSLALGTATVFRLPFAKQFSELQSLILVIASFSLLFWKYPRLKLVYQKKQVRYYITGFLLFVFLNFMTFALKDILPFAYRYVISAVAYVAGGGFLLYAVISYRFTNMRRRVFSTAQEVLMGLWVVLAFTAIMFFVRGWLALIPLWLYFLLITPLLILFSWLYSASKVLAKKVLRMQYQPKDMTELFLDSIGRSQTTSQLAGKTLDILTDQIHCRDAAFYLFDKNAESYLPVASTAAETAPVSAIEPFFRHVRADSDIMDREIIQIDPRFSAIKDTAERYFDKTGAAVFIPLTFENAVTGFLHLAYKMDNTSYSSQEILTLSKLRKVIQITMNNIILFDKEEEARMTKRDLSLASVIQESVFPRKIPVLPGLDIHAVLKPAKGVSGDYYTLQQAGSQGLGIMIADVSGKGFSAALVAMMIHTIARSIDFSPNSTGSILSRINDLMTSDAGYTRGKHAMSFATVFCGYLDVSLNRLFYTNAGHHPLLVYSPGLNLFREYPANCRPAGIFPEALFRSDTIAVDKGDILILYSDGITEAINTAQEEFGLERLQQAVTDHAKQNADHLTESILASLEDFTGNAEQFDDITLIIIKLSA